MATIKLSHVFATLFALFIFDKWLDRKVKSFIDYALTRGNRVENFKPFESTMRVMDGRMYPDSPHMAELPSLTGPQTDVLAPLTSAVNNNAAWMTPMQAPLSAMPPMKTFVPLSDGSSWKGVSVNNNEVENDTPLVDVGQRYQSIAKQNGSQMFDQLMTDLDAQPNLSERYQNTAYAFSN